MLFNSVKDVVKDWVSELDGRLSEAEKECLRDTSDHINKVRTNIGYFIGNLSTRADVHDRSKLMEPEFPIFVEYGPKLKGSTYGSEEYKKNLSEMQVALKNHYENNSHHPEHYPNGIQGMSLMDILEMLADWKAACERHADGNFVESMYTNRERFKISDSLFEIMKNTIIEMGWVTQADWDKKFQGDK